MCQVKMQVVRKRMMHINGMLNSTKQCNSLIRSGTGAQHAHRSIPVFKF